jgi:nitrogen fixation/metabolism regulation signal transduction histidine kinase
VNALTSGRATGGRALLREIRASFYRKLFLAFVSAAVVPVLILALATRAYFATQFEAEVKEAAANTATVAQRLVEDYGALQQRATIDDQIMVLIRRAIDQDVNLFENAQLRATSALEVFASGLLPTRTPGDVYRRIVLDRLPTFVGEQRVGDDRYLLAAAPVRTEGREGIVTVPVTSRSQDVERQRDDLDHQVLSAAVLFSLLGAALGYSMAERIADPINRLARATRRIARGNLDARVVAATSDELGRLIRDFNGMAEELKRQRSELERTQRLEAWADMARQVAHDIKNPLTPIQLSAEHAQRVNLDRGRPLSPVLDECVAAILSQVRLLRQIAAEFSSFASSATPHPEPTDVAGLVEEVVSPYRLGLSGRISIDVDVTTPSSIANVDRTLLARAFTNVIENALHAMPGQGSLRVVISRQASGAGSPPGSPTLPEAANENETDRASRTLGDSIVVEFADTGVGMDSDALRRIFEPYFSTKATGTGLGLTIAKRNVELNGGTIDVRSQRGVGTAVTIGLPASASGAEAPAP